MAAKRLGAGRRFGLPTHLVAFALALLLPTLALAAVVTWHAVRDYRAAFEERLEDTARALALALDAEIGIHVAAVATLAASAALHRPGPDLGTFEAEARRAAASLGTNIILLDAATMRQFINTALPVGTAPTGVTAGDYRAAATTRRPLVSDVVIGAVAQRGVVGVAVPVERDGAVPFVLAARLEPARLAKLLAAQGLGAGEFATLWDGRGRVVAHSRGHGDYVGREVPAWFAAVMAAQGQGVVAGSAIEGDATVFGFQRLRAAPNWTVAVGAPAAAYRESWQAPMRRLALGGAGALLLGTALALLLARRVTLPLAALARGAEAVTTGGNPAAPPPPPVPRSGVREIETMRVTVEEAQAVLARQAAAEREATAALQESERRLRLVVAELDHRAKNALATVQSLAQQTARGPAGADPAEFARIFTGRLRTLARAHDLLTAFAWEGAALDAVVRAGLAPWLNETAVDCTSRIVLDCMRDLPVRLLGPGQVQAVVMALYELATNAVKHGALSVPAGRVEVGCRTEPDGAAAVEWREFGGPALDGAPTRPGFGMRLLQQALARDLGPGARIALEFAPDGLRARLAFLPRSAAAAA